MNCCDCKYLKCTGFCTKAPEQFLCDAKCLKQIKITKCYFKACKSIKKAPF
jgi:hypothetical protein